MNKKFYIIASCLIILGLFFTILGFLTNTKDTDEVKETNDIITPSITSASTENISKVNKVIDGDTVRLENGMSVRYIGIDTPETVDPRRPVGCFGKESSDENKRLVEGKSVILKKDVSDTDKYGRLLRFVYLKLDDGSLLFVNDYLLRNGYARISTYPPDVKFADQFLEAEREARENNRGLWNKCL